MVIQPPEVEVANLTGDEMATMLPLADTNSSDLNLLVEQGTKYNWNKYEQNSVLGCFFWGYVLTELPGGRLAEVIGARR